MYRCALNPRLCIIRWPTEIPVIRCVRACRCWISVINYPSNSCVIGGPERTRRRPQGRETPDIGLGWISIRTSLFWAPIFAFLYRARIQRVVCFIICYCIAGSGCHGGLWDAKQLLFLSPFFLFSSLSQRWKVTFDALGEDAIVICRK